MSKDKKKSNSQPVSEVALTPNVVSDATPSPTDDAVPPPAPPAPKPKLMNEDRLALDLAKERRATALADAKTALAKNETAELNFKYVVLQLYMKYGLSDRDAIAEDGTIVFNGAVPPTQAQ